jgi:hypothetical protein
MAQTELAATGPPKKPSNWARRARSVVGRAGDGLALAAHRLADRLDLVPSEFGRDSLVDETDARRVRAEWLRCLRLWSAYNPEEVFALQVGGGLLAATLVALWLAIALLL